MSSSLEVKKNALLNYHGAMAAPPTPFDSKGNLDTSQIEIYANYLVENDVTGFYILGSTGELYSLTLKEKIALVQAWRAALDKIQKTGKKFITIVNVSSTCVPEIYEFTREVERLNFDGIALLPPIYYQDASIDHLVGYLKHIVDKSSGSTPLLYYHNIVRSFNGILKFDFEQFLAKAIEQIPQFAAIKYADPDVIRFGRIQAKFGKNLNIMAGMDEELLVATVLGVRSGVTVLFNCRGYAQRYLALVEAVKQNNLDEARRIQVEFFHKCDQLRKNGNMFLALKEELNTENASRGLYLGTPREPIYLNNRK